ncbi:MAG: hypothetical protein LUD46_22195 [Parabacteroides sp.]|nr:hypothetical protein [Parabacteroides sp.]
MNKKFSTLLTFGLLVGGSLVNMANATAYSGATPTFDKGTLATGAYDDGYYYLIKNETTANYFLSEELVVDKWIPGVRIDEPILWYIDFTEEYDGGYTATIKSLEHGTQLKFDDATGGYSADGDVAKFVMAYGDGVYSFRNKVSGEGIKYLTNTNELSGVSPKIWPLVMNGNGGADAQFFLYKAGKQPVTASEMNKYFADHFQLAFKKKLI